MLKYSINSLLNVFGQNNIEFIFPIKFSNNDILHIFPENFISAFFDIFDLRLNVSPLIIILMNSDFFGSKIIHILFHLSYLKAFDISICSISTSSIIIKILFSLINCTLI